MKNKYFILVILMIGFVGENSLLAQGTTPKQGSYTRDGKPFQMKGGNPGVAKSSSSTPSKSHTKTKTKKEHISCAEKKAAREIAKMMATPVVDAPEKMRFGLSLGSSLPFARYSEYNSSLLGLAKPGAMAGIDMNIKIHKNWALCANTNFYMHPKNVNYEAIHLMKNSPNATQLSFSKGNYNLWNFMVGIRPQEEALTKKLSVYGLLAGGILVANSPAAQVKLTNSAQTSVVYNTKSTAKAFCLQTQVGLQYDFTRSFGMGLFADMINSKPCFTLQNGEAKSKYAQPVQFWNLGLKLNYVIRR